MTPNHLREIMIRQGLSHNDVATITDVTYRQVTSWLSGAYRVPRTVAITLRALDERLIDIDWVMEQVVLDMKEAHNAEA
jgi:plasmid maintenance system antidote protein VapI